MLNRTDDKLKIKLQSILRFQNVEHLIVPLSQDYTSQGGGDYLCLPSESVQSEQSVDIDCQ